MTRSTWRAIWTIWLVGLLALVAVSFAVLESLAWNDGITLSRYIYDLSVAWPLIIFIFGHVSGGLMWGLAVHFWWHWDPANPNDHRG